MILDTNILLRLIDGETSLQHGEVVERLRQAIDAGQRLHVDAATVIEAAFVLRSSRTGYGYRPSEVAHELRAMLDAPELDVEHRDALKAAAASYADTGLDFHDCYLAARGSLLHEDVFSLDADFKRLS